MASAHDHLAIEVCSGSHQSQLLQPPPATSSPDLLRSFSLLAFIVSQEVSPSSINNALKGTILPAFNTVLLAVDKMPPLIEAFHASGLTDKINTLPSGNARKPQIKDLKNCELKELIQYNCELNGPRNDPRSKVVCEPVLRLFRQCANGATIETTAWEDRYDGDEGPGK
ncbi:hypothetical protein HII31_12637 [Pseudocercospora fuligena]|uniref:Uncharacterized protein n=1 Tax=Pseudocercospora fuligena TaxID=685502 RepID=A0A8H6R9N8_9PEZI|nr:hypothetical protein HII31_12637 [Pseudocercospora fuligena]